jgi:hypothetical protein
LFRSFSKHNFTRYDNLHWLIDKTSVIISINYEYNNENKKKSDLDDEDKGGPINVSSKTLNFTRMLLCLEPLKTQRKLYPIND